MQKFTRQICVIFIFTVTMAGVAAAAKPVTAEQVQQNALAAKSIINEFTQASAHLRLLLEYSGELSDEVTKDRLKDLAQKASERLAKIYRSQQDVCKQIEESNERKWDELYGVTGLWRRAAADVRQSLLYKAQLDYFAAAGSQVAERTQILHETITACTSLGTEADLLRGICWQLLSNYDDGCKVHAKNVFGEILTRSDTIEGVYLAASIAMLKLSEKCERKQIRKLTEAIGVSSLNDDFELNLKLAFLQIAACGESDLLEELVTKFSEGALFTGEIILADIAANPQYDHLIAKSKFEIRLAMKAAINNDTTQYIKLIDQLAKIDKFGGQLLYYAIARAYTQTKPKEAVEYYLKAAKLPNSEILDVSQTSIELAAQAGQLAYQLYSEDAAYCKMAVAALEYYQQLAEAGADEEMTWLYALVSCDCGQETKAVKLLKDIAAADGAFSREAMLDLTIHKIRRNQIHIVEPLVEAVEILVDDFSENPQGGCYRSRSGLLVLANVIEQVERCMSIAGGAGEANNFTAKLDKLAEFCLECASAEFAEDAKLLRIEAGIIAAGGDSEKLAKLNRILEESFAGIDSIELVRIRARLAQGRGDFVAATKGWGRILLALKPAGSEPSQQWWQGKAGQLYCWSKLKEVRPAEVSHAIEVLRGSYNIPGFWAEKIAEIEKSQPSAK